MILIRRVYRLALLCGWQLIIWPSLATANLGSYWKAQHNIAKVSLLWGKGIAWIFGLKIDVVGDVKQLKNGLVVSNHTSYVDILVDAAVLPMRFVPKSSIKKWPFIGWFVGAGRPIWVDRSSRQKSREAAKAFRDTIDNGVLLLVYPEGASTNGKNVKKFKSTPFEAVADSDHWITPTLIKYGKTPDGKPITWHGNMRLLPHIWRLLGYKKVNVQVTIMDSFKSKGRDRKELSLYTHGIMQREYAKSFAE